MLYFHHRNFIVMVMLPSSFQRVHMILIMQIQRKCSLNCLISLKFFFVINSLRNPRLRNSWKQLSNKWMGVSLTSQKSLAKYKRRLLRHALLMVVILLRVTLEHLIAQVPIPKLMMIYQLWKVQSTCLKKLRKIEMSRRE